MWADSLVDDATDDADCPWLLLSLHGTELTLEWAPDVFTIRTYHGDVLYRATAQQYSNRAILALITLLRNESPGFAAAPGPFTYSTETH